MQRGFPVKDNGPFGAFQGNGDVDAMDTLPIIFIKTFFAILLAVDGDVPALFHQVKSEVFGKGFKPSVLSGNTADT